MRPPRSRGFWRSVPEVARGRGMLFRERLDQLEGGPSRQALRLELLQLGLGDFGADLAEARVLGRREPDRLRAALYEEPLADVVERVPAGTDLLLHSENRPVDELLQLGRQPGVEVRVHADAERGDVRIHLRRVLDGAAHLESDPGAAVVDEGAVEHALLQLLELL